MTIYRFAHALVRWLLKHAVGVTVHGEEHIPERGPAILAVNHVSTVDPVVVGAMIQGPLWFMAKEELFQHWGLAALLRSLHAYPVRRDRPELSSIKRTLQLLRQGKMVMIFPEGTRGDGVTLGPVRPGVAVLAARAEAFVVPVYHEGAGRVLPRGAWWPRRHPVRLCFGPPLRPDPAVLADREAAEAFGEELRAQWALLRSRFAGRDSNPHPLRAGRPAPTPREEVRSA